MHWLIIFCYDYSKACVKRPLSKRPKISFQDKLLLNAGQKYCRMLQGEHSVILLTFIKLPFVIKIFVLSIFEWQFYTGFTAQGSGSVVECLTRDRGFEPHQRHCVVSLSKNINPSLVLVQPRKTRPFITERLLMGRRIKSNKTNTGFTVYLV